MNRNTATFLHTPSALTGGLGLILSLLVAAASILVLYRCARGCPPAALWIVMTALLPSFWIFRAVVGPARPNKNWIVIVTPCILLVCYLASQFASLPLGNSMVRRYSNRLAAVALIVLAVSNVEALTPLTPRPMVEAAKLITEDSRFRDAVIVVVSDSSGEGVLVSQVAMRETRPRHFVLRASKVLAWASWFGWEYRPRFSTPEELTAYLRETPVGLLVVDESDRLPPDLAELLSSTLEKYATDWEIVAQYSDTYSGTAGVRVYRHIGYESPEHLNIRVDMTRHFGTVFTTEGGESPETEMPAE